jgi:HlyD family secretion protein
VLESCRWQAFRRKGFVVKRFIKIIIVLILALGVVGIAGTFAWKRMKGKPKPTVVRIEKAERGELIEFVSAPGEIEPKTKVELSAKVAARIVELPYEEGDRVTRGDPDADPAIPVSVLVRLDAKDLESQLLSAEASRAAQAANIEVEKARIASQRASLVGLGASLRQAERDLERQEGLLKTQDVSQATYDQTKLNLDELKARYDAAKSTLESVELNLKVLQHNLEAADARVAQAQDALTYTTITSPIDGIITRINAEVGEVVMTGTMNNPGTVIMEVADLSQMLVVAQVDEADVGKLEVGQKAKIHVDAYPDKEFTGIVDTVALAHDTSYTRTKYYKTEILLDPTEVKLHSGLTAHVDIETRKHTDILKVPTQAVLAREVDSLPLEIRENSPEVDTTKTYATVVYCYNDGKAVVTPVKIGRSDLTHTIITAGITDEDKIVVGPYKVLEKLKHEQTLQDEREKKAKEDKERDEAEHDADKSNDDEKSGQTGN